MLGGKVLIRYVIVWTLILISGNLLALDLELTQGVNSALPIAINAFGKDRISQELHEIICADIRLSNQFRIIEKGENGLTSLLAWRQAGADSILSANVATMSAGNYNVHVELVDAIDQGKSLLNSNFTVHAKDIRALAHHISDIVYQKLTGERGIFSTRIAYIRVLHVGENSKYHLEVADVDGNNPRTLLVSPEPIMSPTWSPNGQKIAYVSFEKKKSQIFTLSVENGKRHLITDFQGINGAPAWSPDGKQLAVVLSKGGSPKIYAIELLSGQMKQLTFGDSIDTEPQFSPNGHFLLFTSNRGGTPQIYRLSLDDGVINRISYEGNYNARARYTPQQKAIVLLHRQESRFTIALLNLDTGIMIPLTDSPADESPSLAPNGRLVIYATQDNEKSVLSIASLVGHAQFLLPVQEGDMQDPAWSPYLS